ncbi:hypothetical protein P280DRAFT_516830 [Massarina eburnea CBS 473.64]|uniref:Uncharacterized protein n=1 Tax=Massarina eburnea CBS 473.64 TaxID=1395130 RepID=A0A6A6S6L4_9PLEO|nr:hypothetical protein P280DRAFT_516830 [Massarina eburnea CBS 473.64]
MWSPKTCRIAIPGPMATPRVLAPGQTFDFAVSRGKYVGLWRGGRTPDWEDYPTPFTMTRPVAVCEYHCRWEFGLRALALGLPSPTTSTCLPVAVSLHDDPRRPSTRELSDETGAKRYAALRSSHYCSSSHAPAIASRRGCQFATEDDSPMGDRMKAGRYFVLVHSSFTAAAQAAGAVRSNAWARVTLAGMPERCSSRQYVSG